MQQKTKNVRFWKLYNLEWYLNVGLRRYPYIVIRVIMHLLRN